MLRNFLLVYCVSSVASSALLSRHKRAWIIDSFTIEEGHPGPFPYVLGTIDVERDYGVHFDLYGEGMNEEPKGVLSIDKESGTVSVHKPVDYEEKTMLKLRFEARKTDLSIDTKLGVEIYILDINDNPPRFQKDLYEINVVEGSTQGSNLLTVVAYDRDKIGTPNSTFHYEIKSVSPNTSDTEFFINDTGTITFKGCLNYEVADMFTILVEAKDHGEVVSLSSSTTVIIHVQDGNNHPPTISRQTGTGRVKENETGSSPLRLHVTDKDSPNSQAWRARYTIQGDKGEHFKIETDSDTNDGILTVVKPLDFEEGAQRELSISVENEAPYFFCQVKKRISSGLWTVDTSKGHGAESVKVIIIVEDTNDPPVFSVTVKEVMLEENSPIGTWVEKVHAVDPDSSHAREFVYQVGSDPAGWVTVNPHTGDITTVKTPDRESPHVVNGIYTILLHAVDNGNPPQTGTATLQIHVTDQNDNLPQPTVYDLDMCLSDSPTTTNITAFDLDQIPFGGPFTFELLGDVNGKWKLDPSYGYTAGLVKDPGVYAGPHTIHVKISDLQGQFGVYNLSVTVCDCSATANCKLRRAATTIAAPGVVAVVFASLILLLILPLMAIVISCKKEFTSLEADSSGETLFRSNTEQPGTDCKVPGGVLDRSTDDMQHNGSNTMQQTLHNGMQHTIFSNKLVEKPLMDNYHVAGGYKRENQCYPLSHNCNQMSWRSFTASDHHTHQVEDMRTMNILNKRNSSCAPDLTLLALLHRRLSSLQETEDYQPHLYAEEGDSDHLAELEKITIPDEDLFLK